MPAQQNRREASFQDSPHYGYFIRPASSAREAALLSTPLQQSVLYCVLWLLPAANMVAADDQGAAHGTGTIQGVVTYSGEVPKSTKRDNAGQQRKLLAVHRRSRGLRYALLYLELNETNRSGADDLETQIEENASEPIVVDQVEHAFQPHLVAIRGAQKVKFTNSDAANHNVHATGFESENQFNVIIGVTGEHIHQFVVERKQRPISLRCDLHPWMQGWVFVFNHPYYAVSDEHGKFRIRSVPRGKYRLAIRQPDVAYRKTLAIDVRPQETTTVEVKIRPEDLKKR